MTNIWKLNSGGNTSQHFAQNQYKRNLQRDSVNYGSKPNRNLNDDAIPGVHHPFLSDSSEGARNNQDGPMSRRNKLIKQEYDKFSDAVGERNGLPAGADEDNCLETEHVLLTITPNEEDEKRRSDHVDDQLGDDNQWVQDKCVEIPTSFHIKKEDESNAYENEEEEEEEMGERGRDHTKSSEAQSNAGEAKKKKHCCPQLPHPLQPGGTHDPLRRGLSGAGCRWYLESGFTPDESRQKAEEHKAKPGSGPSILEKRSSGCITPSAHNERKIAKLDKLKSGLSNATTASHSGNRAEKSVVDRMKPGGVPVAQRVAVLHYNYPKDMLCAEDRKELEDALVREIAQGCEHKLKFQGIHLKNGMLQVDCETAQTAEWVKRVTPTLGNWKIVGLTTKYGEETSYAYSVTIYFPKSAGQEYRTTLALLEAQNDGLNINLWEVLLGRNEGTGQVLDLGIDRGSYESIRRQHNSLSYRFGRVAVFVS